MKIIIFADGSCDNVKRLGGWGYVMTVDGEYHSHAHADRVYEDVTSNQMEMRAALEGLKAGILIQPALVTVRSDSQYVVNGMNRWTRGWVNNGWRTSDGDPVSNRIDWKRLIAAREEYKVPPQFDWVKGHVKGENPWNHVADFLASYKHPEGGKTNMIEEVRLKGVNQIFEIQKRYKRK